MIQSKSDLEYYIQQDRINNGQSPNRKIGEAIKTFFFPNAIGYLFYLRHVEYYMNILNSANCQEFLRKSVIS